MTAASQHHAVERELSAALSRSYFTALAVLGDAVRAEALVIAAVESLEPGEITSDGVRAAVIQRLVRAQLGVENVH